MIQLLIFSNFLLEALTQELPATIVTSPSDKVAEKDQDVRLRCVANDVIAVDWEIRTQTVAYIYNAWHGKPSVRYPRPNHFSDRVTWDSQSPELNQFDLIIKSVDKTDQGTYTCLAKGSNHQVVASNPAQLRVHAYGDDHYERCPASAVSVVGEDVRFSCTTNGQGILWNFQAWEQPSAETLGMKQFMFLDGEIFVDKDRIAWDSSDLVISGVKKSDGGEYKCGTWFIDHRGVLVYVRREATLTVIELPDANNPVKSREEITIETPPQNFALTCNTKITRRERIAWLDENFNILIYDGIKISDNPQIEMDLLYRRSMILQNVDNITSQTYYCIDLEKKPLRWFEYRVLVRASFRSSPAERPKTYFSLVTIIVLQIIIVV